MQKQKSDTKNKAWVVTVDMGYGHQRAAYPLRELGGGSIINANVYKGIPKKDENLWKSSRKMYEAFSRFKNFPFIGNLVWNIFDYFQAIDSFYPRRNLTRPSLQLRQTYMLIKNKKWGKHLIDSLGKDPRPLITTFFIPAFMAEVWEYPGKIFCVVTDADISRAWAPKDPQRSRIHYLAPTQRVAERLKLYGVQEENITLTGFPLPQENIGKNEEVLKQDLWRRISVLDPTGVFHKNYGDTLEQFLGKRPDYIENHKDKRVWVMFAVGGAGAQRHLACNILSSLAVHIKTGKIGMYLVAGVHNDVYDFFKKKIHEFHLEDYVGHGIKIITAQTKSSYFQRFNSALQSTDVLWTKPSELSFYCALGVPIIIAPPLGSQEHFNKYWLEVIGSGVYQENPKYAHEWIIDYLNNGWLAESALQGYLEAPREGVENISKVVFNY